MSDSYVVKPLGGGKVLQAYPLVQTAVPHLSLDQWLEYAGAVCEVDPPTPAGTGVMSAQNCDGYIYGIFCHEVTTDIVHGRILKVSNLITANLYDAAGIMDRMIDSMLEIARDQGCAAVHVDLPESPRKGPQPVEGLAGMLKGAGYRYESVALCRPLERK